MNNLLNVQETAEILHFSEEHVRRLLRKGELVGARIGSDWRISESDLQAFVASRQNRKTAREIKQS